MTKPTIPTQPVTSDTQKTLLQEACEKQNAWFEAQGIPVTVTPSAPTKELIATFLPKRRVFPKKEEK